MCTFPLDAVIERHDLPAPEHLRFARATATAPVLLGAARTLTGPTVKSVFMSVDTAELDAVLTTMTGFGWKPSVRRDGEAKYVSIGFSRD